MTPTELSQRLAEEAEKTARYLFPNGRREGQEWRIGSVNGDKGKSLGIHLSGSKAGVWADFATGETGDLLGLWVNS
jgi:twinkle protein